MRGGGSQVRFWKYTYFFIRIIIYINLLCIGLRLSHVFEYREAHGI